MIRHKSEQYSPAWWRARLGLPTASAARRLITPARLDPSASIESYAAELALERIRGTPTVAHTRGAPAPECGHALEPQALAAYAYASELRVQRVGLCLEPRARFGGSPDALVSDSSAGPGGVEIKCPRDTEWCRVVMYVERHGQAPAAYLPQAHMLMLVTGRPWWDLAFWHPDFPDDPLVCRVHRCPRYHRALILGIAAVRRRRDALISVLLRRGAIVPASRALPILDPAPWSPAPIRTATREH